MPGNHTKQKFCLVVLLLWACLPAQRACAHPMGNFSVNHYTQIKLRPGAIEILYLIDMAEIPTYQEIQRTGIVARENDPSLAAYLATTGRLLAESLVLELDSQRLPLHMLSRQIIFPAGAGGLPTLKMGFVYLCELAGGTQSITRLHYADLNFPGHAGWKEIVVDAPNGTLVSTSAPQTDRSNHLSNYPTDLLNSPPQVLEAEITFKASALVKVPPSASSRRASETREQNATHKTEASIPGKIGASNPKPQNTAPQTDSTERRDTAQTLLLQANRQATPRSSFTELVARKNLSFWFLVLAAAMAAGLGALHALEPGHGKTIVAAYLVGARGTARHALLLGAIVTAAHTAGVYVLGAITLYAQRYILPEHIYPLLGVLSGILIAGMGCYLLLQRHLGADFAHKHSYETSMTAKAGTSSEPGSGELLLLGFTGGMIPCPGALVVLLSAVALHRTGLGLFLIVAFSIGLAAVLIAMGLAAVYAGRLLSRFRLEGPFIQRWLPMISATTITILGFGITVRGLMAAGFVHLHL